MSRQTSSRSVIRNFVFLGVCVLVAAFCLTAPGKSLFAKGMNFISPATAQSAIVPVAQSQADSLRAIFDNEIYLPHEVDLNAGSDFNPDEQNETANVSQDLNAMLSVQGKHCTIRNHMDGAVALNETGCM